MTDQTDPQYSIHQKIHASRGMAHVNRVHRRSFSLNIFRRNAQELIQITRQVRDPDQGLEFWFLPNREANLQIHREVNRLVHNYVASAQTLVDHTRNFIREHYAETPIAASYDARVESDFRNVPVARFVQNIRNYMLHRELPPSEMFLHFENREGSGKLTTGIRYKTSALLDWDGWHAPAREYIESAGEFLDVHIFAEEYAGKIDSFHAWLNEELNRFHADDLTELQALQAEARRLEGEQLATSGTDQVKSPVPEPAAVPETLIFEFPNAVASTIDEAGAAILGSIRQIHLPANRAEAFATSRPVAGPITPTELPVMRSYDAAGKPVLVFIQTDEGLFGLDQSDYEKLQPLAEKVLETPWAGRTLSRHFIDEMTLGWCRSSFRAEPSISPSLADSIASASRTAIKKLSVWTPIAHLEVERPFQFGPAQIAPITKEMLDNLATEACNGAREQQEDVKTLFDRLRGEMQGLAGIVIEIDAEDQRAREEGETIAATAVGLLRFFSPAARSPLSCFCPIAPLGSEIVPMSKVMAFGEGSFAYSERVVPHGVTGWQISTKRWEELCQMGLNDAAKLVRADGLTDFALAIRSSLLLFGTGTTFPDLDNRLVHTLSSLECLLLRHAAEPTDFTVSERMSLLLTEDKVKREEIARNASRAYRMRKQHGVRQPTGVDQAFLVTFFHSAHAVLHLALANINSFAAKADFLDAIDRRKDL